MGVTHVENFDNADGVTPVVSTGYNPIENEFARLAHPEPVAQWITLNPTFRANENSSLSFSSKLSWASPSQGAVVQVSTDGGMTWPEANQIFLQRGSFLNVAGEQSFTERSFSLARFAGQNIRVRFCYIIIPPNFSYVDLTGPGRGWHFDNIRIEKVGTGTVDTTISAARSAGGQFQMSVTGQAGSFYVLECTTDLKVWTPLSWFGSIGLPQLFSEPILAAVAPRFYRFRRISPIAPVASAEAVSKVTQEVALNDCASPTACGTPCRVFLTSGEENFARTDLIIPGRGDIHFVMTRHYRSRLDYDGPLGFGWNFAYNEKLLIQFNGDVVRVNGISHIDRWIRQPDGTFRAPAGHFRTLRQQIDGVYVLREADGFQRFYSSRGRLLMHADRFGNQMLFGYDERGNLKQATDAYGRIIEFIFQTFADGIDRLVGVRDFVGREIVYSYDEHGDLISARSPTITGASTGNNFPDGRTERYIYSTGFAEPDRNHNLLSVTFPEEVAKNGPPAMIWTYGTNPADGVTFDRVIAETMGGINASGVEAGGTMTIAYEMLNQSEPLGNPELPRGKARITLRNGNRMDYFANELGHHILTQELTRGLRPGEPPFYETRSFLDSDGLLLRRIFPEGNELRNVYASGARSQRRNVLETRRVAGPRGGGEDLVTTFTYEPLFNQITSITEPRGNSSTYTPPIGTSSAERYTTRFFYDYQESNTPVPDAQAPGIDLSNVPRNLGDLNADTRTDQLFGNLVRVQAPTVRLLPDSNEARLSGRATQEIITEMQWNDHGQRIAVIDPLGNVQEFSFNPENDPDGDGRVVPTFALQVTPAPAGYLKSSVVDARISSRRVAQTPPAALETLYWRDEIGNTLAVRNPRGVVTEFELNQFNEIVRVMRGADVSEAVRTGQLLENETARRYITQSFYDFNGRVVRREIENRDSNTEGVGPFIEQTFTYDILSNLLERTAEVDASTTLTWQHRYDPEQLLVRTTKPEGNSDTIDYDERNLPFRITRGTGSAGASSAQIDYDLNGNPRRAIDAEDNNGDGQPEANDFAYDGFDRLIRSTDPLGNESASTFDVAGNLIRLQAFGHPGRQSLRL